MKMDALILSTSPLPVGWVAVDPVSGKNVSMELARETATGHALHGSTCVKVARRIDRDDVLFKVIGAGAPFHVVHSTWDKETSSEWPEARPYRDFEAFLADPESNE